MLCSVAMMQQNVAEFSYVCYLLKLISQNC